MIKKLAISCGVLTLLLYGQTQSDKEAEGHKKCISVGPSGALACHDETLDIVTAVVPRLTAANRFMGLNSFARGVMIDTREQRRPDCQEDLRGTFWFRRDERKDSMQVCIREGTRYEWVGMEVHAEP